MGRNDAPQLWVHKYVNCHHSRHVCSLYHCRIDGRGLTDCLTIEQADGDIISARLRQFVAFICLKTYDAEITSDDVHGFIDFRCAEGEPCGCRGDAEAEGYEGDDEAERELSHDQNFLSHESLGKDGRRVKRDVRMKRLRTLLRCAFEMHEARRLERACASMLD